MTDSERNLLREIQIDMMDEIHRICVKNDIKYYIIAGTLLGAVRHGGFIPWDLDIDVAMTRAEYDRFKTACKNELKDSFEYVDFESRKDYRKPHATVVKKNTKIELKYDKYNMKYDQPCIDIDIFPLDKVPENEKDQLKQQNLLKKIRVFKERRIPYCYSSKKWRAVVHYLISFILSFISIKSINHFSDCIMRKYNDSQSKTVCSMASKYSYKKQSMDIEIYGEPVLLKFEDRQYFAPEKYIEYLEKLYGDYMKLPPESERSRVMGVYEKIIFENENK